MVWHSPANWRAWANLFALLFMAALLAFLAYCDLGRREPGTQWSAIRDWLNPLLSD